MASAKQRAWRKKFAAMARSGKFRKKSSSKRRKSTRKGQIRRTSRRAYEGLKRKARKSYKRRKTSSGMKMPRIPSVIKKVAVGVGAASLAGLAISFIAPQFAPIARPVAALAAGGIPGVAGELLLNQGLLGNITAMAGGGINGQRMAAGL